MKSKLKMIGFAGVVIILFLYFSINCSTRIHGNRGICLYQGKLFTWIPGMVEQMEALTAERATPKPLKKILH